MNSEPELSAEARRVIAAAKSYDDPSADDRERVKTRWLATVAAAASVSTLGEVARAAGSGWGVKAAGWVLALAAGAAGVFALMPGEQRAAPLERIDQEASRAARKDIDPPAVAQPPDAVLAAPPTAPAPLAPENEKVEASEPVVALPPPAPPKPVATRRPTSAVEQQPAPAPEPAVKEPTSPELTAPEQGVPTAAVDQQAEPAPAVDSTVESRQLGEETLLLSRIRRSLRDGAAARALEELAEYRRRFEKPLLGMEAAALRVDALCRSGNVLAGRAEAETFYATWPSSPLEQRVRASCP